MDRPLRDSKLEHNFIESGQAQADQQANKSEKAGQKSRKVEEYDKRTGI